MVIRPTSIGKMVMRMGGAMDLISSPPIYQVVITHGQCLGRTPNIIESRGECECMWVETGKNVAYLVTAWL